MGLISLLISWGRPNRRDRVPRKVVEQVIADHSRQLAELQEAVEALQGEQGHNPQREDER